MNKMSANYLTLQRWKENHRP